MEPWRHSARVLLFTAATAAAATAAAAAAATAFELHAADSMAQVRRGWQPQEQCREVGPDDTLTIEMVQNEQEAAQLVVTVPSYDSDSASNLTWAVGPLTNTVTGAVIPASDVVVTPLGFVAGGPCPFDTASPISSHDKLCPPERPFRCALGDAANNTARCVALSDVRQCVGCAEVGAMLQGAQGAAAYDDPLRWWPHLLLDYVKSFDVARGTAQPLLVTVRSRTSTAPGTYSADVTVTSRQQAKVIALSVSVRAVALSDEVRALSLWGEQVQEWVFAHPHTRCNDTAYAQLLLDHRIPAATSIYSGVWPSYLNQSSALHPAVVVGEPGASSLRELWQRGQRALVVGSFCHCTSIKGLNATGCMLEQRLETMVASANMAKAAGWQEANLYVYLLDETDVHPWMRNVTSRVHALLPRARTVALGDNAFPYEGAVPPHLDFSSLEQGGWLEGVDILIPRMPTYANLSETAVRVVREKYGRQVGWYTSGVPAGSFALNTGYAEYPAMRGRLLLGTAAWKYKSDAFLYYSMNGWKPYSQGARWDPSASSALTRTLEAGWVRWINASYGGEGQLVAPGPPSSRYGGFVPTLQLEGVRDGLEDLELYHMLDARVRQASQVGIGAAREAEAMVVPASLLESVSPSHDQPARTYSEDPYALRAQWRAVVAAIESLDKKLAAFAAAGAAAAPPTL
jgi:hypothetical protein